MRIGSQRFLKGVYMWHDSHVLNAVLKGTMEYIHPSLSAMLSRTRMAMLRPRCLLEAKWHNLSVLRALLCHGL
jgi:hypothetical protein